MREYVDLAGHSAFARWFNGLNAAAAARVTVALYRVILLGGSGKKRQSAAIAAAQPAWAAYKRTKTGRKAN